MNNIIVLIFTCSAFSDMWENNIKLMDKNWPHHPDYLLCSDGYSKYNSCLDKKVFIANSDMSSRMMEALSEISNNYEYIFLTLDDYYISKTIDERLFEQLVTFIKEKDIDYCRFYKTPRPKGEPTIIKSLKFINASNVYDINFYPAIWKTKSLLSLLRKNEDIWKCEARLTRRFKEKGFKGVAFINNNQYPFVDVVRKGKYLRSAYRYLKKNHLFISDRQIRTRKETFSLNIQTFVSHCFPKKIKAKIKQHLKKRGRLFYSDFADYDD